MAGIFNRLNHITVDLLNFYLGVQFWTDLFSLDFKKSLPLFFYVSFVSILVECIRVEIFSYNCRYNLFNFSPVLIMAVAPCRQMRQMPHF